jgi:hypothetical protein
MIERPLRRPATGLSAIRQALEDAGVEFIAEHGAAGVRLRKGVAK